MDCQEATKLVEALFQGWGPCLSRYAYRLTCDREAADDLVQEAFLSLYQAYRRGEEIESPRAWALAVVRRLAAMRRRNQGRHREELTAPEALSNLEDPRGRLDEAEEPDALALLQVLTKREQEIVLMRIESLKYREIASALRISQKTVETLLARALKKMRRAAAAMAQGHAPAANVENNVPKTLQ